MPSTETYIHHLAVVENGVKLGAGTKVWHFCHVRNSAIVGEQCILGKGVYVDSNVVLGNRVKVQNNASIYHGVTIEDGVFIGPHVCFTNDLNPRAVSPDGSLKSDSDWAEDRTLVRTGASIGANSTIVAGITLGEWCLIGAGSVVTKNVPPYALAYGHPARVRGVVSPSGEIVEQHYRAGEYLDSKGQKFAIRSEWVPPAK